MSPGRRRRPTPRPRLRWSLRVAAVAVVLGAGLTALVSTTSTPALPGPDAPDPLLSSTAQAPSPAPPPTPSLARAAVDATDEAASSRDGADVGVAVLDLATGDLQTNDLGAEAMNAASLAKLFTIVDTLYQRDAGRFTLDAADTRLIQRALGPSDDDAMNALWSRFDGAEAVQRVIDRIDLDDTTVPDNPSQWGEVQTSARDMTRLFAFVRQRLAPGDRDLVLSSLAAAPATAADGFDQAYGLFDPADRGPAAAKQGWLCCLESSIDLHSAGLLAPDGRYAVALLSNQPFGYDPARRVLDDAAAALRRVLAP